MEVTVKASGEASTGGERGRRAGFDNQVKTEVCPLAPHSEAERAVGHL